MTRIRKQKNITLSDEEREKLSEMAKRYGMSDSSFIRFMIHKFHEAFESQPGDREMAPSMGN